MGYIFIKVTVFVLIHIVSVVYDLPFAPTADFHDIVLSIRMRDNILFLLERAFYFRHIVISSRLTCCVILIQE